MSLGERIQKIRRERGFTQKKLSDSIGLSRSYLADIEHDRYNPSLETLDKISSKLNISIDYLLKGFDPKALVSFVNFIRDNRSYTHFAEVTGINEDELFKLCTGLLTEQPSIDTIIKIANNNQVSFIVDNEALFEAAGYPDEYHSFEENITNNDIPHINDPEALAYLDELHKRPEMKALFQVSRRASKEDIERAITIIEALKKKSEQ